MEDKGQILLYQTLDGDEEKVVSGKDNIKTNQI